MIALRRCKLCNGCARMLVARKQWEYGGEAKWWARCADRERCGADSFHSFPTEEEATTYWNATNLVDDS